MISTSNAAGAADEYDALYRGFHWHVPPDFNIARLCAERWAGDAGRVAILYEDDAGHTATLTYSDLWRDARQLAQALRRHGVARGDRVAIVLPQRPETAIAHIACHLLGAVAMPLSILFGPEALAYRLQDSAAVLAIVDQAAADAVAAVRADCPALKRVLGAGCDGELDWDAELALSDGRLDDVAVATGAGDPAILIYTSGTTGAPKGALLPQSALLGNLTGFVASQNWFPQDGDVFWSPADWAWTGGLMDALLPALYFGMPIVGYRGRFSAETAFRLMEKYGVTNTFLFPTALKMMMKAVPAPREQYRLKLRAIMSAGEAVGDAVFGWGQAALGVTINEMFGQTEMNYIVGNSAGRWPARPGSMGRPYPGHRVAVIDDAGNLAAPGEMGEVALHRTDIHGHPDPVFFLGYWNNAAATEAKYSGDWCRTGDLAVQDADGYLWYQGRADDMFKAAGYRIGPSEIENCLVKHPAVVNAAVIPKPDPERGNVVKAFIVLASGVRGDGDAGRQLVAELQEHVRGKLAPYEYPKEIEFLDALPMTTTGKVQRRVLREMEAGRGASAG
ncbi:acyl-CoA synthetase [Noviherbaspirillum suwonense]|uniref:Acetyl-CoA synthetase n=1 Tax=Noviherbaspirillum suwonense TaxID=1224511 RepID=A0ABY1QGJ4_9BURK|nr:AMP-binding protein [Noviherbaspirillum suwonense]SMP70646.1 acetyl-CoA synthetase [Noviherbaspirillum suwonense]